MQINNRIDPKHLAVSLENGWINVRSEHSLVGSLTLDSLTYAHGLGCFDLEQLLRHAYACGWQDSQRNIRKALGLLVHPDGGITEAPPQPKGEQK